MNIIANHVVAKLAVAFVATSMLFTLAMPAKAATIEELQATIAELTATIAAMTGGSSTAAECTFTGSLTVGSQGAQVTCLQQYLVAGNHLVMPTGVSYGYFGPLTKAAVAAWQAANGVAPAVGYFGPLSQAKYAMVAGSTSGGTTGGSTSGSSDLEGGAGSISVSNSSEYSSEEVGEDEEDVEVLQAMVEADDSDVEITSVKVEFVQSSAADSEDLTDYAKSVSIWFDGEMVGEADADDFSESSDVYTKSIALDKGVIIREDDEEAIVVAVTALSNLDSGDIDSDAWTVDILNIRFVDGDGVTTTTDTDGDTLEQSFDFASFASAADVELKISLGDEEINDAHVINVSASNTTDNVEILSFMMESEGDSDILIKDVPVTFTSFGADVDDVTGSVYLFADGKKIGTESVPTSATTTSVIVFDDLDYTIDAGDEVEFIVKAKVKSTAGTLADGDTISAAFGETETSLATFDAEDESGEELDDADVTGTATGDAHAVYDIGFNISLVSATETKTVTSDTSGTGDQAQFVIKYEITPFDGDIYIDNTCTEDNNGSEVSTTTSYSVTNDGSNTTNCVMTASGSVTNADSANTFLIKEGSPRTITLTVNVTATADAFAAVSLEAIGWDDATGGDDNVFDFSLPGDFETDPIFLNLF